MTAVHLRPGVAVGDGSIHVSDRDVISETIMRLEQGGEGFRTPLFRAARDGLINLALVAGGDPVPPRALSFQQPTVILLADDHPDATGPGRWKQAAKLLRWARSGLFHAAAGEEVHYAAAAIAAGTTGRLLLIEMRSEHHPAWLQMTKRVVPRLPVLNILPTGGVHPIAGAPSRATVQ